MPKKVLIRGMPAHPARKPPPNLDIGRATLSWRHNAAVRTLWKRMLM
jgi:hypothetical protein